MPGQIPDRHRLNQQQDGERAEQPALDAPAVVEARIDGEQHRPEADRR